MDKNIFEMSPREAYAALQDSNHSLKEIIQGMTHAMATAETDERFAEMRLNLAIARDCLRDNENYIGFLEKDGKLPESMVQIVFNRFGKK